MNDVESASLLRQRPGGAAAAGTSSTSNAAASSSSGVQPIQPTGTLPPNHPYHIMQRIVIMGAALWGLHEFGVYHAILRSPKISHLAFKVGLACSVGTW
mmetsp:Transcript_10774/g.21826  ORF Transcript_10774/g.21826 Transcript_10774/m.21826 type:complete len:99 (+) Transcript_10774:102-398(+)